MERVVIIGTDHRFYRATQTLVASIHRTSMQTVDKIFIYDLGLKDNDKVAMRRWDRVTLLQLPEIAHTFYDGYLDIRQFAWKTCIINEAQNLGDLVFYLDAGVMVLHDLRSIYDIIEQDEIFVVGDGGWKTKQLTTDKCFEIMKATEEEKNSQMICAGIQGYKPHGNFQDYVTEAFLFSQIKDCIQGSHDVHRQDQSIYSVLAHRYKVPRYHPIHIYGEYTGIKSPEQMLFVHRGAHAQTNGLRRRR